MSRLASLALALAVGCAPSQYAGLCDGVTDADAQIACFDDAADLARGDVTVSLDRALAWCEGNERCDRDVWNRINAANDEIDRIHRDTTDRVRDEDREGRRTRHIDDGLRDLDREVDRCDRDLEEHRPRDDDGRDPSRGDDDEGRGEETRGEETRDDGGDGRGRN